MAEGLAGEECFVCGVERLPHQIREQSGEIMHQFALDGAVKRSTLRVGGQQRARPTVMITVVPTPDLALRKLLIEKGIIAADEIVDVTPQLSADDLGLT